jgi:sugar lactone lactonase YvrE
VRRLSGAIALLALLLGLLLTPALDGIALAVGAVERVVALPAGDAAYALAAGGDGLLYVGESGAYRQASIFVYTTSGSLERTIAIPAGPSGLISPRGLAFDQEGNLYVADSANGQSGRGRVIKVNPRGRQSVLVSGLTAPNGLAVDGDGVLYVSDGLNGAVLWIGPDSVSASFVEDDRLKPHNSRGLGAAGLAFAPNGRSLYVANTADNRLLRVAIHSDGSAGKVSVLADAGGGRGAVQIDGPEGLMVDASGNLLVASSRGHDVELVSPEGKLLGRMPGSGDNAFHSPTGVAVSGRYVYVANLAAEYGVSHLSRFRLSAIYGD